MDADNVAPNLDDEQLREPHDVIDPAKSINLIEEEIHFQEPGPAHLSIGRAKRE